MAGLRAAVDHLERLHDWVDSGDPILRAEALKQPKAWRIALEGGVEEGRNGRCRYNYAAIALRRALRPLSQACTAVAAAIDVDVATFQQTPELARVKPACERL